MEFKVKEVPKIKVVVGENTYDVAKPTVKQVTDFQMKLELSGDKALMPIIDFLSGLGLPSDVVENWTIETLNEFVEFLVGRKKS